MKKNNKLVCFAHVRLMRMFRNKALNKMLATWCAFATIAAMSGPAWAISGALDSGSAALTRTSDNVGGSIGGKAGSFNLTSGTAGVLDWSKLSLNSGESLNYNSAGSFYNVVNSAGGMSTIAGAIKGADAANVYIINPNGILFNSGSSVNVGGIFGALATGVSGAALDSWIANPNVLPDFSNAEMTGDVTVKGGTIKAAQIALAGLNVSTAEDTEFKEETTLAAGDKITIDGFGGGSIKLTIPKTAWEGDVDMLGQFANNLEAMAAGNVRAANGVLTVVGDLKVNTYGDVDIQPGAFVVNNAEVSAKSISATALGDVSVVGKTDFKTTEGDLNLVSQNGQFNVLGTASGDAATIQATGGDLTISAVQGVVIGEHAVVAATKKADSTMGNVTLTSTGKDVLSDDGIQIAGAGAKVSAENGVTFTAGDGNITIKDGAGIEALSASKTLAITATKGAISEDATSSVSAKGTTVLKAAATEDITLASADNDFVGKVSAEGANISLKDKNDLRLGNVAAKGAFEANAVNGAIYATDGAQVLADEKLTLNAKTDVSVDNATVAGKALIVTAGGGVDLRNAAEVSGENVRLEAKGDDRDVTVAKGVTVAAAKNLTVVAEHDVNASGLLKANDGSVYAKAGNDVKLGEGQVVQARGTDGNVLLEAGRDIVGVGGQEAIVSAEDAGPSDGYIALVAERDAGANIRIDGKMASTRIKGDATLNLHGDVELTLEADGNVTVNHTDGTLSVVKGGASVVDAKVNEVVDAETLVVHKLSDKAGSGEGLIGKNVAVRGSDGSSLDVVSVLRAAETADASVDGDAVVHGRLEAGSDVKIVAGGDVSVVGNAVIEAKSDVAITARDGKIEQTGDGHVTVGGVATLKAAGDITLANAANDFQGVVKADGANVTLKDKNDLTFGAVQAKGTLLAETVNGSVRIADTIAADENLRLEAKGVTSDVTIDAGKTVTAGKNATVKAGRDFSNKGSFVAKKESAFVEAERNVELGAGALVSAGSDVAASAEFGNVLVKAGGDIKGTDPTDYGTIHAGNGGAVKGAVVLDAGGAAGENLVIEAGVAPAKTKGDATLNLSGDTTLAFQSTEGNVTVNHRDGTLTIDSGKEIFADYKVNEVLPDGALNAIDLSVYAADIKGLLAGGSVEINGDTAGMANSAVNVKSVVEAGTYDAAATKNVGIHVDKDILVDASTADDAVAIKGVLAKGDVTLKATGVFEAKNAAVVKAGQIDEATPAPVDNKNLTIDAATVRINTGAKVVASGAAKVTAKDTTVDNATLAGRTVALDAKSTGEGAVTIQNGATVAAYETLAVGGKDAPATLTVQGADTKLVAQGDLTADAGKITARKSAKVASDKALTLTATAGAIDVTEGAQVLAKGEKLMLDAKTDMLVDNATVAGSGDVEITAQDGVGIANGATLVAGRDVMVTAQGDATEAGVVVESGARIHADWWLTLKAEKGDVKVSGTDTQVAAGGVGAVKKGHVKIEAKRDVEIANNAKVSAEDNDGSTSPNLIVAGLDAGRNVTIDKATLAASKGITIDAAKAVTVRNSSEISSTGGQITIGGDTVPETLTVDGSQVNAERSVLGKAEAVTVGNGATIESGQYVNLIATEGDLLVDESAITVQNKFPEALFAGTAKLEAEKGSVKIEDSTLSAEQIVQVMAEKSIGVTGAAVLEGGKDVILWADDGVGDIAIDTTKNVTALDGAVSIANKNGSVTIKNATVEAKKAADGTDAYVAIIASGNVTVQDGANVTAKGALTAKAGQITAQDNAKLASDGALTLTATEGALVVQNGAQVLAKDAKMTLDAQTITIRSGAKVAASGDVKASAKDTNVNGGQLAAGENVVIDAKTEGEGTVIFENGANVYAQETLAVGGEKEPERIKIANANVSADKNVNFAAAGDITVAGEGAMLTAGKAADLTAGNDLMIREDAVVMARGKGLEAGEKALTIKAMEGSIAIDGTTGANETLVSAKGGIGMEAKKDVVIRGGEDKGGVMIESYDTLAARAETGRIEIRTAFVSASKDLTLTADKGDVTAGGRASLSAGRDVKVVAAEGAVTMADVVQVGAGRDVVVTAEKDVSVRDGANVFASRDLIVDATAGKLAVRDAAKVDGRRNMRLAAGDDTTVETAVSAGKNLTVIGKDVAQNADFTAESGSVYVEATAGDIVMKAGTVTEAKRTTDPNPHDGEGNILYTAMGDVRAEAGGAAVVADPTFNDGAIVLHSEGGSVGENMTLKAARVGAAAKGDVETHLVGNVKIGVTSQKGSITLDHEAGTLTVDKSMIGANDKVVKVLSATETELIDMKDTAGESRGLEAATYVNVTGHDGSTVIVDPDAGIIAHNGNAAVRVDKNIVVGGKVNAAADAILTAGGDTVVNGSVAAGSGVAMTAGSDATVNGSVAAGNDVAMTAGRNVVVGGTVKARRDAKVQAKHDVEVDGLMKAGHDAIMTAGRNVTVRNAVEAANDQSVVAGGNLATPGMGRLVAGRDLFLTVGSSTPQINIAVGKGVSARSGERALAFRTVGGCAYPEVYGNDSKTAVFIDGRVAGGNSADFSILQGYEQVAALGNVQLTPFFTYMANFNVLGAFVDAQAPGAAFAQASMTSDKGEIVEK